MIWQDWVIFGVQFIFMLALVPSLRGPDKPAYCTSITTCYCLLALAITYATLLLVLSAIVSFVLAYLWGVLAVQVYRRDKARDLRNLMDDPKVKKTLGVEFKEKER